MRKALRTVWLVFAVLVVGLLAPSMVAAQARVVPMPPNLFTTKKLNDHLYVIMPSGPDTSNVGGNIGVCVSDQGVFLVDANYDLDWRNGQAIPMAQAVIDEVKKITNQPIRWVVNTHHHGDHAGGDPVFPELRDKALGKDRIIDPALVIERDPEVIIASWCGKAMRKRTIVERPGWDRIAAVRDDRIFEIKSTCILQPGPASLTDGVRQLHAILEKCVAR